MSRLDIALVVHGRFHAFDLARALLERGHAVTVFTNYPRRGAARFGLPMRRVSSFPLHGVVARAGERLHARIDWFNVEAPLHRWFGRWAAGRLAAGSWDVAHVWTGVSEELLRAGGRARTLLMRGSAHIRTQDRLLREEEQRVGHRVDRPSPWMIDREEREYALADKTVVLSTFAYQSFLDQGVPSDRLALLPLGAELDAFRPAAHVVDARVARMLSGEPLRVLYVGALSFRKGIWDLREIVRGVDKRRIRFRIVGPPAPGAAGIVRDLATMAEVVPKQPEAILPAQYEWADLFVFPTIEDGYGQVLAQAAAGALPILATTNCIAPDLIHHNVSGWVLPIRAPEQFMNRLAWCHENREALAAMGRRVYDEFRPRSWDEVAADFVQLCRREDKVGSAAAAQGTS